nr:MoaD/ThiS family protein [Gemmatimonas phototrophica]
MTQQATVAARVVRVVLPSPLRALLSHTGELALSVTGPLSLRAVLDALEAAYPVLRGTIRDHGTHRRRAFVRFYACEQDLSLASPDDLLPEAVQTGREPLLIVGAMAGG